MADCIYAMDTFPKTAFTSSLHLAVLFAICGRATGNEGVCVLQANFSEAEIAAAWPDNGFMANPIDVGGDTVVAQVAALRASRPDLFEGVDLFSSRLTPDDALLSLETCRCIIFPTAISASRLTEAHVSRDIYRVATDCYRNSPIKVFPRIARPSKEKQPVVCLI